jgi:hypothetical protein
MSNAEPELDPVAGLSVSTVKLIRNTKGVNWEIRVSEGTTEEELVRLRTLAVAQHEALAAMFPESA